MKGSPTNAHLDLSMRKTRLWVESFPEATFVLLLILYFICKIIYLSNEKYGNFYAKSFVMCLPNKTSVYLPT